MSITEIVVKNLPACAGDTREEGLILGLGRSPGGGGMATHSSTLAWEVSWTKEHGGAPLRQSMGSQRVGHE